jgi:NodT family efflux transporter outer membrane factor (OMF) lipoprotein
MNSKAFGEFKTYFLFIQKLLKMNRIIPFFLLILIFSCVGSKQSSLTSKTLPQKYLDSADDTTNMALRPVNEFFKDSLLIALIDSAITNNTDYLAAVQQIEIARAYYLMGRKALLPSLNSTAIASFEKFGEYTPNGVGNYDTNLSDNVSGNRKIPVNPTTDYSFKLSSAWELDIWGKLNNARKSARARFWASAQGAAAFKTLLIAEVANAYYELLAFDEELLFIERNINLQKSALDIVKVQKQAGKATNLAVQQFEAQLYNSYAQKNSVLRMIAHTERYLGNLTGSFSQTVKRGKPIMEQQCPGNIAVGVPAQLLNNRPDLAEASQLLQAAGFDVSVAQRAFWPSLSISPFVGFNTMNPDLLLNNASLTWGLTGGLTLPLFHQGYLKAMHRIRQAEQKQALYNYHKVLLRSVNEVQEYLKKMQLINDELINKNYEVAILDSAVNTSHNLYVYGYATYLEVINAQKNVRDAQIELVEVQKERFQTIVALYRALGGGR